MEDTPGGWDFGQNYKAEGAAANENNNGGANANNQNKAAAQQQPAADEGEEKVIVDREWDKKFKDWQLGMGEKPGPHPYSKHLWNTD